MKNKLGQITKGPEQLPREFIPSSVRLEKTAAVPQEGN